MLFCRLLQVLITPHSAFLTHEALANIASTTISNLEEFLSGQQLTNELKPKPEKAAGAAR
jgi:D-lactate dehydrogenase